MKQVTAVLIGAGGRGMRCYAPYALNNPHELKFTAVAEPQRERREEFKKLYNIPEDMCFESWEQLLEKPRLADAAFICTQDRMHYEPTVKALNKKYHVLVEKPMSPFLNECIEMADAAEKNDRILSVCYVLRYTNFFRTIKELLDEGRIGRVVSIQHNENVAFWHHAHSYVRGNWRNTKESSPMILAKSSHDMDILHWLVGAECVNISSFGDLMHFKSENAPAGAPKRCLDGCPKEKECPYFAPRFYFSPNEIWDLSVISSMIENGDNSREGLVKALNNSPYGRCVYHCDNDVVDHQVVNMEFANGVTAAFTMCAFTENCSRTIKIMGTKGELRGDMLKNEIEVTRFLGGAKETIELSKPCSGHGGGDEALVHDFVKSVRNDEKEKAGTTGLQSIHSHVMAFAAEHARLEKRVVSIKEYIK